MDTENEEKEEKPKKGLQSKVFGFGGGIKNVKDKVREGIDRNIKKVKEGKDKVRDEIGRNIKKAKEGKDKVRYEIGRNIKKAKKGIIKKKEQIIK